MKESSVQWSDANEEDYKNGERLVIKHNKVNDNSKNINYYSRFGTACLDWLRYRL